MLLTDLIPSSCGVLISTREQIHEQTSEPIQLSRFDSLTGDAIIRSHIGDKWSDEEAEIAALRANSDQVQGFPLALGLVGDLLSTATAYKPTDLLADLKADGVAALQDFEILEKVFQHSYTRVSPEAQQVFSLLGVLANSPARDQILATGAQMKLSDARKACDSLIRHGLLRRIEHKNPDRRCVQLPHVFLHQNAKSYSSKSDLIESSEKMAEWITEEYPTLRAEISPKGEWKEKQEVRYLLDHLGVILDQKSLSGDTLFGIQKLFFEVSTNNQRVDWEIARQEAGTFQDAVKKVREEDRECELWYLYAAESASLLGENYFSRGEYKSSLQWFDRAQEYRKNWYSRDQDNWEWKRQIAIGYLQSARWHSAQNQPLQAMSAFQAGEKELESFPADQREGTGWLDVAQRIAIRKAICYMKPNMWSVAMSEVDSAINYAKELVELQPDNLLWQAELAHGMLRKGKICQKLEDSEGGKAFVQNALNLYNRLSQAEPGNPRWERYLARASYRLGRICETLGDWEEALQHFSESSEIRERIYRREPLLSWVRAEYFKARWAHLRMAQERGRMEMEDIIEERKILESIIQPEASTEENDLIIKFRDPVE